LTDCLARSGVPADSIDHCLIPEGNVGWMLDSLREAGLMTPEWQAMEGKIFDNLSQTGAVGCAAVPLSLDHGWRPGLVKQGDRALAGWDGHDVESLAGRRAEDVLWDDAALPRAERGRDEVRRYLEGTWSMVPDLSFTRPGPRLVALAGPFAAQVWRMTATMLG